MKLLNSFLLTLVCAATISSCCAWTQKQQEEVNWQLINSASTGDLSGVEQALAAGADINAHQDWALRWAAGNGHLAVVRFLVEHGANIHADYDRALRSALERGHLTVVDFLQQKGANIDIAELQAQLDNQLLNAIYDENISAMQHAIAAGANIHVWQFLPLRAAIQRRPGSYPIVVYLLRHGAKIIGHDMRIAFSNYILNELQLLLMSNNRHQVEELLSLDIVQNLPPYYQEQIKKLLANY